MEWYHPHLQEDANFNNLETHLETCSEMCLQLTLDSIPVGNQYKPLLLLLPFFQPHNQVSDWIPGHDPQFMKLWYKTGKKTQPLKTMLTTKILKNKSGTEDK